MEVLLLTGSVSAQRWKLFFAHWDVLLLHCAILIVNLIFSMYLLQLEMFGKI